MHGWYLAVLYGTGRYMPAEMVAREGAIGRSIFLVQSGVVKVMLPTDHQALDAKAVVRLQIFF
eukprot:COSAG05_NODE_1739_length_4161_cov_4.587642_5_plen_63_part_00